MSLTKDEATKRVVEMRPKMKAAFEDPSLERGELIVSCDAVEEMLPNPAGEYIKTGKWLVSYILGWKTWRGGNKYGNFIFLDDENAIPGPGAVEKLVEVLQIQMDHSMKKV